MEVEITKTFECDVQVVGGGVAGYGAAVSAARSGAKVILAEANGYLGGCATAGLVAPFMTCYDRMGENQIIRGAFDDLVRRLVKEGGAVPPEDCRKMDGYSGYKPFNAGHLGTTPFDKEAMKRVMEETCIEAGVDLRYHYLLIAVKKTDRRVTSCVFATRNGFYEIKAKEFIDCSGEADLAYRAGAEYMFGGENGELQPPSTFFLIDGVNEAVVSAHMGNHSLPERERRYMDVIEEARKRGEFPCGTEKVRVFKQPGNIFAVNMCQIDEPFDVNDPDLVTKAEIEGKRQVKVIFDFLKKYIPGFENIRLLQSSDNLGIRESRRVVGEYVLRHDDILNSTIFDETLVVLSKKIPDSHINIDVEFGEGEGQFSLKKIKECAEARKPKEKVTYKMIQEYIEKTYGFKVHTAYIAEVKRDLGLPMYDAPNAVEELKRPRAHPTPKMAKAIKETLKHFEII